ncbi:MAG: ferrous iron transport protein A [Planctomycetes bacterium]|nr:ferrous iron transport protein A [Planctomycetota bacterium]
MSGPTSGPVTSLAQLDVGERARVVGVRGGDEISQRLLEMGLTPGVEISLLGRALLGDPIEIEVRGYRLSVRRSEAERVEVEVIGDNT